MSLVGCICAHSSYFIGHIKVIANNHNYSQAQRRHQEERVKKALERAQADAKKMVYVIIKLVVVIIA